MKSAPFTYHRPTSETELGELLLAHDGAKLLAGGQSLLAMMNLRYVQPDHVIDLAALAHLKGVMLVNNLAVVGAMTTQAQLMTDTVISAHCPLMVGALRHVGHRQTRSRGTLGGSLCHLDPAAELPAVALCHDAVLEIVSASGRRDVGIEDWFIAYMTPALGEGEYLSRIRLASKPKGHGWGFREFARRQGDFALAGAACLLIVDDEQRISDARAVVFGVETRPRRLSAVEAALIGSAPSAALFARLTSETRALEAVDDAYASGAYRRRLGGVMLGQALTDAARRATGGLA